MSDITNEAPERIWLQLGAGDEGTHTWADHQVGWDDEGGYEPEYVRADLVQVAVAAAYEKAGVAAVDYVNAFLNAEEWTTCGVYNHITALIFNLDQTDPYYEEDVDD